MEQYLAFFRNYKKAVIVSSVLVIADVVLETVQPGLMSRIVDTCVRHKDIGYILRTGGLMIFLSLMAIAANAGNIYYSSMASVERGNHEALLQKKGKYYALCTTQFD